MAILQRQPALVFPEQTSVLRRVFSFPAVLAALTSTTTFAIARAGLSDPDIWWHLRNAEILFARHAWLRADLYSFTAYGRTWINHEWLSEIPYYLAWRAFGLVGIKALSLLVIEIIFGGLLYLCRRTTGHIKASACACYLAIFLGSVSFGPRTILFGYCCLIVQLLILEQFRSLGRAPLWLLPPLYCLWINLHGSWSLGLIVLAIFIGSGLVEGRWGKLNAERWSSRQIRKLGVATAASIAALFVNPYGYGLVLYPFDMAFNQKLNISHVAEWSSVDFHDTRGKIALLFAAVLFLGALLGRHEWRLHELGYVLFSVYLSFTYIRFLFLAGILAAPLVANLLASIPQYRPELDRPMLNATVIVGLLAFVIFDFPTNTQLANSVDRDYPEEVLSQLASLPPTEHVLNYYLWGGYLGWKIPAFRDFIDSRVDVFEHAGVLQDYLNLLELKNPDAILDKYRIQYILFPPGEPLTYALEHDSQWKVDFRGNVCVLFERIRTDPTAVIAPSTPRDL